MSPMLVPPLRRLDMAAIEAIARERGASKHDVVALQSGAYHMQEQLENRVDAIMSAEAEELVSDTPEFDAAVNAALVLWDRLVGVERRLAFPFRALDRLVGALVPGEIVTVLGVTAGGKTTFAMNLIDRWIHGGQRVQLLATEMSKREVLCYALGMDCHFIPDRLITQDWTRAAFGQLAEADVLARLRQSMNEWFVPDRPLMYHLPTFEFRASRLGDLFLAADEMRRDVLVIDHLMMLNHDLPARGQFEAERRTLYTIRALARLFEITVVLVAQVNQTRLSEGDSSARFRPPLAHHAYGGQQLSFVSSAVLSLFRPMRKGADGKLLPNDVIREALRGGDEQEILEPHTVGVYGAKLRRRPDGGNLQAELRYHYGYLFDDTPHFPTWHGEAPVLLRAAGDAKEG